MTQTQSTLHHRVRRKGGGRKFFDGKYNKRQFDRRLYNYFRFGFSIKHFLQEVEVSRQSLYRYLNKYPAIKADILGLKNRNIAAKKQQITDQLQWLRKNPDAYPIDYHLRNIAVPNVEINLYS